MEVEEPDESEAALEELASQTAEDRGAETLALALVPPAPVPTPSELSDDPSVPPYSRGFLLDLALKTAPVADLLAMYRLTTDDFKKLVVHPRFRSDFTAIKEQVASEGFTFRAKAQAQAEVYLHQAWTMVHDRDTPANVRADLIKWTTKVANLEPKPADAGNTSERITININLGDDKAPVVINGTASTASAA